MASEKRPDPMSKLNPVVRNMLKLQWWLCADIPFLGAAQNYWFNTSINISKTGTFLVTLILMAVYDNWTWPAWQYFIMHGSYGILWVAKDIIFPDPKWAKTQTLGSAIFTMAFLAMYWIAGFLLISSRTQPPTAVLVISLLMYIFGVCTMLVSDAQKYYTLKFKQGLIVDGMFARTRNPNYVGEMLLYSGFALLSYHTLPWIVLGGVWGFLFFPNMFYKDASMSRHPGWAEYTAQSGMLLPSLHSTSAKSGKRR